MISLSVTAHNLGVTMDAQLFFSPHTANLTRFLLSNIRKIYALLSTQATRVLVQMLLKLDNCT